ncbi:MAG: D-alanyl-D-alanine carboxypeptidase/D-alanyl-D-alanine-endopeptidase [Actinomycetota bacterium]|nr:D-alanyl-D-alanine carboxypeptidase/D-alanyl-D-alanine-endopeptidase [Actinomycetota bacterium]
MPNGERRRHGVALAVVAAFVVVALVAGGFAVYGAGIVDRLTGVDAPPERDIAPAAVPPPPPPSPLPPSPPPSPPPPRPALDLPRALPAPPVLVAADGPTPRPNALRARVAGILADDDFGEHVGVLVEPLARDRDLLRVGGADRFVPASTTKLLTALAALETLRAEHRFTTRVVRGRGPSIVLVGGGDPLLAAAPPPTGELGAPTPATLSELAAQAAARLRADGVRRIRLGYDSSLFTGPAASPTWEPSYVPGDVVTPISALWADEGRVSPGGARRHDDPARAAADTFARRLERRGMVVRGRPVPTVAGAGAAEVAAVSSPPLVQIVEHTLAASDNEAAEVLLRHVGLETGRPGSFAGGVAGVRATLDELGVDLRRVRMYDGSGLSRANRVTLETLADTLRVAADPAHPGLRRVVSGLPVAGFTGSLAYRFTLRADRGLGVVRAKTGTLSGVHALAGVTLDRAGSAVIFVAVADRVDLVDTLDARALLDRLAAAVASCGCR